MSELYSPVTGEVTAVNEELNDDPALINAEPYQLGWIFRVRLAAGAEAATGCCRRPSTKSSPRPRAD